LTIVISGANVLANTWWLRVIHTLPNDCRIRQFICFYYQIRHQFASYNCL